jgi:succinate-semialdehyde dehydrogenase/glutarate-semialdehyde dehydrogenase
MYSSSSSTSRQTYRVQNPATGIVEREYAFENDDDLEAAVELSRQSYDDWSCLDVDERCKILRNVADSIRSNKSELAELATKEMGKPIREAVGEVEYSSDIIRYFADRGPSLVSDMKIRQNDAGQAFLQKKPIGPVLGIMPWNYPYYQVARFAGPNLVLGNTVLLKHAEICPSSALAIQSILDDAGVPEGVYQTLLVDHDQVSNLIADPRVQGISLTGSERAGASVASQAGANLKKVVLELGGSDPYVVLSTDNVKQAARQAWDARMANTGQSCVANKRIIVMDDIYDEFVDELVSLAERLKPEDPMIGTEDSFAPLSSENAAVRLLGQLQDAVANGAILRTGGERHGSVGFYISPCVLEGVTPSARAYREELFGPVAMVFRVGSEDEAIGLANDSPYGLGGSVFSTDYEQAKRVADKLEVGMAHVNAYHTAGADLPFGGIKGSGFGRELGPVGLDEFANRRLFTLNY